MVCGLQELCCSHQLAHAASTATHCGLCTHGVRIDCSSHCRAGSCQWVPPQLPFGLGLASDAGVGICAGAPADPNARDQSTHLHGVEGASRATCLAPPLSKAVQHISCAALASYLHYPPLADSLHSACMGCGLMNCTAWPAVCTHARSPAARQPSPGGTQRRSRRACSAAGARQRAACPRGVARPAPCHTARRQPGTHNNSGLLIQGCVQALK